MSTILWLIALIVVAAIANRFRWQRDETERHFAIERNASSIRLRELGELQRRVHVLTQNEQLFATTSKLKDARIAKLESETAQWANDLKVELARHDEVCRSLDVAQRTCQQQAKEITRLQSEHDGMKRRKDEREKDVARLEAQLVHALATMDSTVKAHTRDAEAHKLSAEAVAAAKGYSDILRRALDDLAEVRGAFKATSDHLYIELEESRAANAKLLETVKLTADQVVHLATEFASLRRLGFHPPSDVPMPTTGESGEFRFSSTDEADADAVKEARNVVMAND